MIGVIDYDAGNIRSVLNALEWVGASARLIGQPAEMDDCRGLVLPGVGAFRSAMDELEATGLADGLRAWASHRQRPLLGVCAGMQLLAARGEEGGTCAGLGLAEAAVIRITPNPPARVPHIGWNEVVHRRDAVLWGPQQQAFCYFAHSYAMTFEDPAERARWVVGETDQGGNIVAMVEHDNVMGAQFHPEKSQKDGLAILRNFVEAAERW